MKRVLRALLIRLVTSLFGVVSIGVVGCSQKDIVARACNENGAPCSRQVTGDGCAIRPPLPGGDPQAATQFFGQGLCACGSTALGGSLTVDGFDSRDGPYVSATGGGSVGTNLRFDTNSQADVAGDLIVGGDLQAGFEAMQIGGSLTVGGTVAVDGNLSVGGDADVAGTLRAGNLSVGGRLTQPAGASRSVGGTVSVGSTREANVNVDAPCVCPQAAPVVESRVAVVTSTAVNDPLALAEVSGTVSRELACGVYAYDTIAGGGALTLRLAGPTVIVVDGDVSIERLDIELSAGAQVDIFVDGGWRTGPSSRIGDPARPNATRLYVASTGTINLGANTELYAQLWGPDAEVVVSGRLEVHGSLLIRRLTGAGPFVIHEDRAVDSP